MITVKEKEALKEIQKYSWFKSDDLKKIIDSERMTYVFLKKWIQQGKIVRLPFYVYSPINPETEKYKSDLLEVACQVNNQVYLCVVTAAKIHGLEVPDSKIVYIASYKKFSTKVFDGWSFRYKRAVDTNDIIEKGKLRYTSYTLTVIDTCKDFQKYMDLKSFRVFLKSVDELQAQEVIRALDVLKSKVLHNKIGWLVENGLLNINQQELVLQYCLENRDVTKRSLYPNMEYSSVDNDKWKLIVPEHMIPDNMSMGWGC